MSSRIDDSVIDSALSPSGPSEGLKDRGLPQAHRWWIAILAGFIFFILACPLMYRFVSSFWRVSYFSLSYWLVITFVFIILMRILIFSGGNAQRRGMKDEKITNDKPNEKN